MIESSSPDRLRIGPYALTGGRVRSSTDLALETIVRTTGRYIIHAPELKSERRGIGELAEEPISIVEIAAHLVLPLGVIRVIVGDMVSEGLLIANRIDETEITRNGRPDQRLLERVLHGLQTL